MFEPTNEQGVVFFFAQQAQAHGWFVVEIGASYPDAIFERNGERWKVEFEFSSSNFIDHRHDCRECDLIVCWMHDYRDCPLPVIELSNGEWYTTEIEKSQPLALEVGYWRQRAIFAENKLKKRASESSSALTDFMAQMVAASDVDLRDKIKLAAQRQIDAGQKVNKSKIAELLNCSRTTVQNTLG